MRKILLSTFLAVTLAIIGAQFNQAEATTGRGATATVVSGIDYLILRSGPSTKYDELARIPPGTQIYVGSIGRYNENVLENLRKKYRYVDQNFVYAEYNGIEGYVHLAYLTNARWNN